MNEEKVDKDKFLTTARQRASHAFEAWDHNYERMDIDIAFLDGDQWPEEVKKEREDDGRPFLTFNKLPAIVDQIIGEQRQMRPAINIFPSQGDVKGSQTKIPNQAGKKNYSLAQVYEGIIRNIEYSSNADIAYDTAFEQCASWGLGYFQITAGYDDDQSFDQEFKIKRIRNYKSVLLDPDFQEPDGSDAQWGFIFSKMLLTEFETKYPNKTPADVEMESEQYEIWVDGDYVFVADYYYLKDHKFTLHQLSNGQVVDAEKVAPVLDEMEKAGITVVKTREVDGKKCCWAKISGADILEEEKDTVFKWIPIIPVLGKELVVDGTPYYRGAIRHALDASRMYNYSRTSDIERTALIPKVPYIIADKQLLGYENDWGGANAGNKPYLTYKHVSGIQKPAREPPVGVNSAEVNQSMQASDDIKSTTGMFDPSMGNVSSATSGKQEMILQQKGDRGSYAFSDNMVRSIRHAGRILLDAIPKLYDTNRLIRLRFPDDSEDFVEINKTVIDEQTGEAVIVNDISVGKFDIVVKAGPSHTTQRMEAAESISSFISSLGGSDPIVSKALVMLAAQNMDWPEADNVVKIIKKSLPPEYVDAPDEDEPPPPPPPPPTPADIVEMQKAEAMKAKAEADIKTAQAKELKAQADILEVTERMNMMESNMQEVVATLIAQTIRELGEQGQPEQPGVGQPQPGGQPPPQQLY